MNANSKPEIKNFRFDPNAQMVLQKNKQQQQHNAKQILYHFLVHRCVWGWGGIQIANK